MKFSDIVDGSRIAIGGMKDFAAGLAHPSVRLGVTGLARSGKTVFVTALVHALAVDARLPLFLARPRIARAYLEPQPDDSLPRFPYERHLAGLTGIERTWPESTKRMSQLRLTIDYAPRGLIARNFGPGRLHVDIVDYPGEWLLDLPLLSMSFAEWSNRTFALSRAPTREALADAWHAHAAALDAAAPENEAAAEEAAQVFTTFLARCREKDVSLASLPPGRFLMPGDHAGSPLVSFAPLDVAPDADFARGTLGALMARRYDSYVARLVKPFFFDHFARLDRQIVLVDALAALNAGAGAIEDLKDTLAQVLSAFRVGANGWVSTLFGKRVDRLLFAASKVDLLHQESHDRLEGILEHIVADASGRAAFAGAEVETLALAAIRATREATVTQKGEAFRCIAGTPEKGEAIGKEVFDGQSEAAIFPGDLPDDPRRALSGALEGHLRFVKFRPPRLAEGGFPHIRLDRALDFLIGDRLA